MNWKKKGLNTGKVERLKVILEATFTELEGYSAFVAQHPSKYRTLFFRPSPQLDVITVIFTIKRY